MYSSIKDLDNGPVYIRENGKLHLVSGTGNFSKETQNISKKPLRLFQKGFSVTLGLDDGDRSAGSERKDHFIFVYTKEGNLRYTAKKLFDISLAFIAEHVQHIDSLIGFPEQVAKKLFFAVEERQKFVDPNVATKALCLFNEAYGELMLKSLCLRNGYLLLSEKLQEIKSFQGLSCLDLSCCKLGDDHDFLDHLTSDNLTSLLHLSLQDNCLSDRGLRKLTAPVRVMKRGLNNLKVLNLSCNPRISEAGVGYICCFKKLNSLDITGTAAKMCKSLMTLLQSQLGLLAAEVALEEFSHEKCKTEGWAEQVVLQWNNIVSESANSKQIPEARRIAQCFYGTDKTLKSKLEQFPLELVQKERASQNKMQFRKAPLQTLRTTVQEKEKNIKNKNKTDETLNNKKRSLENEPFRGGFAGVFWVIVLLQHPRSLQLELTNRWPDILLQDFLVDSRIHGSIYHSKPSRS
ncbi:leucine-rich repeat-containing protein 42 isoform X3 [Erpetoichthys calabaricus]|nr:leucine-rich repeat-containing protein 42 isoform X3 [Erpetoichthys calabaricus]